MMERKNSANNLEKLYKYTIKINIFYSNTI